MTREQTDLTFFTNDPHQTLLDRFKATLADPQLFDVLGGYFRSSGFYSIEPVGKTRILVGRRRITPKFSFIRTSKARSESMCSGERDPLADAGAYVLRSISGNTFDQHQNEAQT